MNGITRFGVLTSVIVTMVGVPAEGRQAEPPHLTRDQRTTLQAIVAAVDRAPITAPESEWPIHILRASDGSHYVAFSLVAPPGLAPNQPVALYVRLATRRVEGVTTTPERSAVAEWLAGERSALVLKERGIAFGEMPTYGPGSIASRGTVGPQGLQLLEMERERARERREARARERKARLEGESQRGSRPLLPFEDFDLNAVSTADSRGATVIRRSLTAGPGEYVLSVAWVDRAAKDPARAARVLRHRLSLPIASTSEFGLSSVIIADSVAVTQTALGPDEQSKRPYSIGPIEIVPSPDTALTSDESLSVVVQVINPRAAADGKPDVAVGFRLYRTTSDREEYIGILNPQIYNRTTLPADFDVSRGHPIFAAVQVPVRTFKRGAYRMQVMADDRLGGVSATADANFSVVATPAALLRDAPGIASPFRRAVLFEPPIVAALVDSLRPARPSSVLAAALEAARERRFIDLIREDPVDATERGLRAILRGLALYALGDSSPAIALPLRQATEAGAPPAPVHAITGALRALDGNDRDAVKEWQAAIDAGLPPTALRPLMIDAYLRQRDFTRASELAEAALAARPGDPDMTRGLAAAHLGAGRLPQAIALIDQQLTRQPDDLDAQWLLLHALFAGFVHSDGPGGQDAADRARFKEVATRYIGAKGPHSAMAAEWLAVAR